MRRFLLLATVFVLLVVSFAGVAAQGQVTHTVAIGESLSMIAARYGTTVGAIANANGIFNVNRVFAGQQLVIPLGQQGGGTATPVQNNIVYIVQVGDTLQSLSARFNTTAADILAVNGLTGSAIFSGLRLVIPVNSAATVPVVTQPTTPVMTSTVYVVQPGDTLASIAARFGTTVSLLAAENNITNINRILVGQQLSITAGQGGGVVMPPTQPQQPVVVPPQTYVVQPGDTLFSIAAAYQTNAQTLSLLNGGIQVVGVGDIINVPQFIPAGAGTYVVQAGDTLTTIASRFGTSVINLVAANQLQPGAPIYPGQQLIIAY